MDRLKEAILSTDEKLLATVKNKVEVVGRSVTSCLRKGSEILGADLSDLDYEIIERGKTTFLGLSDKPFRILVSIIDHKTRFADLEDFSRKLGVGDRLLSEELDQFSHKDKDGKVLVRLYKSGAFLAVYPPEGSGHPVDREAAELKLQQHGVSDFDEDAVARAVKEATGELIKVGTFMPRPENDSTVKVDISQDEMRATIKITPPKPGGRHLELQDVVNLLKSHGVVLGFMEKTIKEALDNDRFMQEITAAKGIPAKHGDDAYIDYKVDIKKDSLKFEEDASGRVDFKKTNLVENVVIGQILAEKVPATRGQIGKTLFNRYVDAKDGKDIELKPGRNTILSDDGMRVMAEINGQVVFASGKIHVESVYRVQGDVGPKTGNIMFLGSVVITGSVLDNYEVKAAGTVEVLGAVQKAKVEAEGDITVRQGIVGREGAQIESTGGSLFAKFIQAADIKVDGDVVAGEGILHSNVEAGGSVTCNGRRAQITGGSVRAKKEVRARTIGSQAYTQTEITVGTDPRLLAQAEELDKMLADTDDKLKKTDKSIKTLSARKQSDPEAFTEEHEAQLKEFRESMKHLADRKKELEEETAKLKAHMDELSAGGKVNVEKEIHPGVIITIKEAKLALSDTYRASSFYYDNGYIKIGKFEKKEEADRYARRR